MQKMRTALVATLLCMSIMLMGMVPAFAEEERNNTTINEEEFTAPIEGISLIKNSPQGYSVEQPEGVTTTQADFSGHTLVNFIADNSSILSIDSMASNETQVELTEKKKLEAESKPGFELISEGETTLGGEPAESIHFKYEDELGTTKETDMILSTNNGFEYVIMKDLTSGNQNSEALADEIIASFQYIPVEDDNISKMVKTKMKQLSAPDKGYRSSYYSYTSYEYYSWDYYYDWCYCSSRYIDYYCYCWW